MAFTMCYNRIAIHGLQITKLETMSNAASW
jgi:hypothetical protein